MVEIPDNYLIMFLAAVFIPTFIFAVKMIMEVSTISTRLEGLKSEVDIRIKELCKNVERIEKDIENIFSRLSHREKVDE